MTKQQALAILRQATTDSRIRAEALKIGLGYRVRLTLRPGSPIQRVTLIGKADDYHLMQSLWEGL